MITTHLTKLTADEGKLLTDGSRYIKTVILRVDEKPEDYQEVDEIIFKRLMAKMTPREFILKLIAKGITREQIEAIANTSEQIWAELNYATTILRSNPLLDQLCGQFGMTPADVDEMFGL